MLFFLLITSCSQQTKEDYLAGYKSFINEIKQNKLSYTDKDWENNDKKHQIYTDVLYNKFKEELTFKDEVKIGRYQFQYELYKMRGNSTFVKDLFKDYKKLKEQIKFYAENDMEEDIKFLIEEAREIGVVAQELIEEIINELEIEI